MTQSPSNERQRALWWLLGLTAAAYCNGLTGAFVFDDFLVAHHAWAWKPLSEWGWGRPNPFGHAAQRPLVTAAFYLDYWLFGKQTPGYHVLNVFLHGLNVALAWRLFQRIGVPDRASWIAAAVFAIHPVQTESVTYIAGRRDLLQGLAYLLLFHYYLSYRTRPSWKFSLGFALALFIAVGTKESLFLVPAVLVAFEATAADRPWAQVPAREKRGAREVLIGIKDAVARHKWLYILTIAGGVPYILHRAFISTHTHALPQGYFIGGSPSTHFFSAAKAQIVLFWRLLFPMNLLTDYSPQHPAYSTGLGDPLGWGAVALLAAFTAGSLWAVARRPWVGFVAAIIGLGLLPSSQIFRHNELTQDHYLYIPLLGFGLLLALGEQRLRERLVAGGRSEASARQAATVLAAAVLALYGVRDLARNRDYRTPETFWSAVLRVSPECGRAWANLGSHARLEGRVDAAREYLEKARRYNPLLDTPWANLGTLAAAEGRYEDAIALLTRAAELNPTLPYYRFDLASLYLQKKQYHEAWEQLEAVKESDPENPRLAQLRGMVLTRLSEENARRIREREAQKGDTDEARSRGRRPGMRRREQPKPAPKSGP